MGREVTVNEDNTGIQRSIRAAEEAARLKCPSKFSMTSAKLYFLALVPLLFGLLPEASTCQVCAPILSLRRFQNNHPNGLGFVAVKSLLEARPGILAGCVLISRGLLQHHYHHNHGKRLRPLRSEQASKKSEKSTSSNEESTPEGKSEETDSPLAEENKMSSSMIASIGFYKQFISPLLPPACRFVPTCSQYGVQAITEFGPAKGSVLIAWRLLRCSPIGGKGYDPPKWPPVPFTYSSY